MTTTMRCNGMTGFMEFMLDVVCLSVPKAKCELAECRRVHRGTRCHQLERDCLAYRPLIHTQEKTEPRAHSQDIQPTIDKGT